MIPESNRGTAYMTAARSQHKFPTSAIESRLFAAGARYIAGIDEVGRGPLAGPVVAAAVVLPNDPKPLYGKVNDSKKMTERCRTKADSLIKEISLDWSIAATSVEEVDKYGINTAVSISMRRAVNGLNKTPDYLLNDAVVIPKVTIPQQSFIKGDSISISIAAASVIAKVFRDALMVKAGLEWPVYGFTSNKGYGTPAHMSAITKHGPCPLHRKTFEPVKTRYYAQAQAQ